MHVCRTYSEQGVVPVTDCGSVHRSAVGGQKCATREKRPWAAVWAGIDEQLGQTLKVKAHLTLEQSRAMGQEEIWHGNVAADAAAKQTAAMLLPPEAICQRLRNWRRRGSFSFVGPRPCKVSETGLLGGP